MGKTALIKLLGLLQVFFIIAQITHAAEPQPFKVAIPQDRLDRIMGQVRSHQYPSTEGLEPWKAGLDGKWFQELGRFWAQGYDWRRAEAKINKFSNFRVSVAGKEIHYVLEKGSGSNPTPLVLLHGWPYSFYSFLDVVEPLAHPERFGGKVEDAFDVILITTPGTAFSESPDRPESLRALGRRYHELLTDVLGYKKYIVHGGDQGAVSAAWMAHDFPNEVLGHHVTMFYPRHAESPWLSGLVGPNPTAAETKWINGEKQAPFGQLAYILTHGARGETLSASLYDNPVGQAAWMAEKWYYWTDKHLRPFDKIISNERLLDEMMVYISTNTFRTSMWPYIAIGDENIATLKPGEKIDNPAGITAWPDPVFPLPPQEYVQRARSQLVYYAQPVEGGHFPSIEVPTAFVDDLRAFSRTLKSGSRPLPPISR